MPVTIELDDSVTVQRCDGCGREHQTVRGYLYKDGGAWVTYWASLYRAGEHRAHPVAALTLAIADDWSDDGDRARRSWAQLDAWPHGDQVLMGFTEPRVGALDGQYFGEALSRQAALDSEHKQDFLEAAEEIAYQDHRVALVLATTRATDGTQDTSSSDPTLRTD